MSYMGAFYGGLIQFPNCGYILDMARSGNSYTVVVERGTTSIEYNSSIKSKKTKTWFDYSNTLTFDYDAEEIFPCSE